MDFTIIKRHPVATGAVVVVGGLVLFLAVRGGSGDAGTAPPPDTSAADMLNAQLADRQATRSFQLAYLQQQQAGSLEALRLDATTSTEQQRAAIEAQLAGMRMQSELQSQQIEANLTMQSNTLNAQLASKTIDAETTRQLATLQSETVLNMAGIQAALQNNLAQMQTDMFTTIREIDARVTMHVSDNQTSVQRLQIKKQAEGAIWAGVFDVMKTGMMMAM